MMTMIAKSEKRSLRPSSSAILAALALALVPASLQAKVIKVPSVEIATIQQGVDAAAPGDTVLVLPGIYECPEVTGDCPPAVQISKAGLRLKAAGAVQLLGPGSGSGTAIRIEAGNVCVEGFEISGFGKGIVGSSDPTEGMQTRITGNTIHDCLTFCIELRGSSNYEVAHNTLVGGLTGMHLQQDWRAAPQGHLHHNRVTASQGDGIRVDQALGSKVDHNVCDNNGGDGIFLARSEDCTVDHNQTDNNVRFGIEIGNAPNCAVTGNEANNNTLSGICVYNSCGSSFERNAAVGNGVNGLYGPWQDLLVWGTDPACNTYLMNRAGTASPSLEVWDVKASK